MACYFLLNIVNIIYPLAFLEYFNKVLTSRMNPEMIPSGIVFSVILMGQTLLCCALVGYLGTNMFLCNQHRRLFKKN
ncbi:MAG: hypothetical protein Hyperionvirus10_56 [Hyperionvirus sp.]|uniref:Uncharacterized protein n=1 Tax=Hyperionvirus sp. TaxID=2487770 RepID=A0A3G5A8X2_9VIRU|nr:MAG: hypothetical protein Hyperionvirus10_56 [Hyperionvirus sp.]